MKRDVSVINVADDNGFTPLLLAAKHHNTEACKLLLQCGSNVHARAESMNVRQFAKTEPSLKTYAIIKDYLSKQEEFMVLIKDPKAETYDISRALDSKVDPNVRDRFSKLSALMLAIQNQNHPVIELLCEHKADVSLINESGDCPLHQAVKYGELMLRYEVCVSLCPSHCPPH